MFGKFDKWTLWFHLVGAFEKTRLQCSFALGVPPVV